MNNKRKWNFLCGISSINTVDYLYICTFILFFCLLNIQAENSNLLVS